MDPCLYFDGGIYVLIYVDDILIFHDNPVRLGKIVTMLSESSDIKVCNQSNKFGFLGIDIEMCDDKVFFSQGLLALRILNDFNMFNCQVQPLPMEEKLQLEKGKTESEGNTKMSKYPYRELLESLMYLMLGSRPDLCFTVNFFSKFQNCYSKIHWKHSRNVLKYV